MRFRALDGWRGVCALLVALHHIEVHGLLYGLPLVRHAWMFVDFFFVLSGFVIAHAYGERLSSGPDIRNFVIRRFGRLYPLHLAVLAALVGLELVHLAVQHIHPIPGDPGAFGPTRSVFAIFTNLLLVQDFGIHDVLTWNGPSWSISAEFYTYLVFAGVCALTTTRGWRIAVSTLLAVVALTLLLHFSPYGMRETFHLGVVRCLFGFFTGVLVQELWRTGIAGRLGGSVAEVAAVAAVVVFVVAVPGHRTLEYWATPLFALTVLVFSGEAGIVSRAMVSAPIAALGRWSYSIYMVHTLVIACVFSAFHVAEAAFHPGWMMRNSDGTSFMAFQSATTGDLFALSILAAVIGLSALTYRHIELPGQRWAARRVAARHPVEMSSQIP